MSAVRVDVTESCSAFLDVRLFRVGDVPGVTGSQTEMAAATHRTRGTDHHAVRLPARRTRLIPPPLKATPTHRDTRCMLVYMPSVGLRGASTVPEFAKRRGQRCPHTTCGSEHHTASGTSSRRASLD